MRSQKTDWNADYSKITSSYNGERPNVPADISMLVSYEQVYEIIKTNIPDAKKIVEIGCGGARNSIYLSKKGYQCVCIDYSDEAIKLAHKNAESEKVANIDIIQDDILAPRVSVKGDVVISFGLLEHFSDLEEIINACANYSRTGSLQIHVVIPKRFSSEFLMNIVYYPFRFVKRLLTFKLGGIFKKSFRDFPHYENSFSVAKYKEEFERQGFAIEKVYCQALVYPLINLPRPVNQILSNYFGRIIYKIFRFFDNCTNPFLLACSPSFMLLGRYGK